MTTNKMSQEEFENIEKYLKGLMSPNEKVAFEKKIEADPKLKQSVEDVRISIEAIEEVSFRNQLDKMHDNISHDESQVFERKNEPKAIPFNWKRLAIAASVAVLIAVGWFALKKPNHEKLYAQYFSPDPGLVTPMSSTHNYEFFRGMVDYKQGDFQLANDRWETLLLNKPTNDTLLYYLGVSNLALDNNDAALLYLRQLPDDEKNAFTSETFFYRGLSELKAGNIDSAKKYLSKSDSMKADELIDKLK